MSGTRLFLWLCVSLLVTGAVWVPPPGLAHPMGNFSINHFSAIELYPSLVRLVYVLDFAEIPTFQEMQEHGVTGRDDAPRVAAYRARKVQELQQGLVLQVEGQRLPLLPRASTVTFPPGAGGLPTLRIEAVYEAPLEIAAGNIFYEDRNYAERVGWKEIVITPHQGVIVADASVPAQSKSNRLTTYTGDLLQTPPQDLRATCAFAVPVALQGRPAASASLPVPTGSSGVREASTPRNLLTELITARQLSIGVVLLSLLAAFGLGAFHALEPGHGKTLVAVYLVGSRGTAWHALLLGLVVTASHTLGVYALGALALFAAHYVMPEHLYPWLGLISGLLIAGMGVVLLTQAWQRTFGHTHLHAHHHYDPRRQAREHGHSHPHAPRRLHTHPPHDKNHDPVAVGYGTLLTLGVTGGMVPCPAAIVVLLSAVALQRITFGLLLIVAFSLGLAAVLVGTGLLCVSARGLLQRWGGESRWQAYVPFVSPLVITPLGLMIAFRSLSGFGGAVGFPF